MERDEVIDSLVNHLLVAHEDNVKLRGLVERQLVIQERQARASEKIEHHLDANIPAIMTALGAVREDTAKFNKEDTPTPLRLWDRFVAAPREIRWMVYTVVAAIALSGWAGHLWRWVSGGGH